MQCGYTRGMGQSGTSPKTATATTGSGSDLFVAPINDSQVCQCCHAAFNEVIVHLREMTSEISESKQPLLDSSKLATNININHGIDFLRLYTLFSTTLTDGTIKVKLGTDQFKVKLSQNNWQVVYELKNTSGTIEQRYISYEMFKSILRVMAEDKITDSIVAKIQLEFLERGFSHLPDISNFVQTLTQQEKNNYLRYLYVIKGLMISLFGIDGKYRNMYMIILPMQLELIANGQHKFTDLLDTAFDVHNNHVNPGSIEEQCKIQTNLTTIVRDYVAFKYPDRPLDATSIKDTISYIVSTYFQNVQESNPSNSSVFSKIVNFFTQNPQNKSTKIE